MDKKDASPCESGGELDEEYPEYDDGSNPEIAVDYLNDEPDMINTTAENENVEEYDDFIDLSRDEN